MNEIQRSRILVAMAQECAARYALSSYEPGAPWAERVRAALTGLLTFLDAERAVGQLLYLRDDRGARSTAGRRLA